MPRHDFYKEHALIGMESRGEFYLKSNDLGGTDVYMNGTYLPDVATFDIQPEHPFPELTVHFHLSALVWDDEILESKCLPEEVKQVLQDLPRGRYDGDGRAGDCGDVTGDAEGALCGRPFFARLRRFFGL